MVLMLRRRDRVTCAHCAASHPGIYKGQQCLICGRTIGAEGLHRDYARSMVERPRAQQKSKTQIAGLKSERDRLRSERDGLKSERDALRSERDALRSERDTLISETVALRSEGDDVRSERDALRSQGDALRSEKASLDSERTALRSERDTMRSERDVLKTERDEFRAILAALTRQDRVGTPDYEWHMELAAKGMAERDNHPMPKSVRTREAFYKIMAGAALDAIDLRALLDRMTRTERYLDARLSGEPVSSEET